MSTYIELVNRAEAAADAAEQSALNTANNKTIVQGLLSQMQGIVANAATLPIPSIQVNPSTGIVTAEYTATAGNVLSSTQRIGTLDISSLLAAGQGTTTEFYKCASVNTVNQTWDGYKATQDPITGAYSFESNLTVGLSYSSVLPQIGGIYSDGALIKAGLYGGLPTLGLVFYAPLNEISSYATTGQALSGAPDEYTSVLGIPCARFSSPTAYLSASDSGLPHGNTAVTLSIWLNYHTIPSNFSGIFGYGGFWQNITFPDWNSVLFSNAGSGNNALTDTTPVTGTWYNFVSIYDGNGTITNYVNGSQSGSPYSVNLNIDESDVSMGTSDGSNLLLAAARIYNRALTATEIAALAAEFTPTTV